MKWLNCERIKVLLVVFVAAIVFVSGRRAVGDFTIGDPIYWVISEPIRSHRGMSISHDGLRLYITPGPRDGGYGENDIWVVERESTDAPWCKAVNLGANINSAGYEDRPTISPDDLELYFRRYDLPMRSTRASKDEPWGPATGYAGVYPEDFSSDGLTKYTSDTWQGGYGGRDIWVSTRAKLDEDWSEPVNLGSNVNNSYDQTCLSISSDNLALFFVDKTPPRRLVMCVRDTKDDEWGPAVSLGPAVNAWSWTNFPEISPDGSTLYFNSEGGNMQVSIIPICDFNADGFVDTEDLLIMIDNWDTDESLCDIGPMPWGDGIVDIQDLIVLADYMSDAEVPLAGDINCDGLVDFCDLAELAHNWLRQEQ